MQPSRCSSATVHPHSPVRASAAHTYEVGKGFSPSRKHTYSTILKILPPKNENFQIKNSDILHSSAQNTDRGHPLEPPPGGSNEHPQSMLRAEIRKIMYTPVNPSFTI